MQSTAITAKKAKSAQAACPCALIRTLYTSPAAAHLLYPDVLCGVDVLTARDQMGHKDISVTLGIYTSLDKKFKKKKINRLDSYLKKQTG